MSTITVELPDDIPVIKLIELAAKSGYTLKYKRENHMVCEPTPPSNVRVFPRALNQNDVTELLTDDRPA